MKVKAWMSAVAIPLPRVISIIISGVPASLKTMASGTRLNPQPSVRIRTIAWPRKDPSTGMRQTRSTLLITGINLSVWPKMVTSSWDPTKKMERSMAAQIMMPAMAHSSETMMSTPMSELTRSLMWSGVGAQDPSKLTKLGALRAPAVPSLRRRLLMALSSLSQSLLSQLPSPPSLYSDDHGLAKFTFL